MAITDIPSTIQENYEIHEWRHATTIMIGDFPEEWAELLDVLSNFRLRKSFILTPGGGKSPIARAVNGMFSGKGWKETQFNINIQVDDEEHRSPTHKVDYYKNKIAIEMEWNNKDPFYDRDLNNFRLLHSIGVISVGVIITRTDDLQQIFNDLGRGRSFGASTTHMSQLLPRVEGGGAGGCPVLALGISKNLYDPET